MKILIAGAISVIGRSLIPQPSRRGHQVAGVARTGRSEDRLASHGAQPLKADALSREDLFAAANAFRLEVIVNQLTALTGLTDLRYFVAGFRATNGLRTRGTRHLLGAARSCRARRFASQGYCGWPQKRIGGPVKSEDEPLDPNPPKALLQTFDALQTMERPCSVPASCPALRHFLRGRHRAGGWRVVLRRRQAASRPAPRRRARHVLLRSQTDVAGATVAAIEG